jgi:hypothetical protein
VVSKDGRGDVIVLTISGSGGGCGWQLLLQLVGWGVWSLSPLSSNKGMGGGGWW